MKLYPVKYLLYNQQGPLPSKFSVSFSILFYLFIYLLYYAKSRGTSDNEAIHTRFV